MEGIKTLTQTVIACFTDSDIIEVCLKNIKKVKQSKNNIMYFKSFFIKITN